METLTSAQLVSKKCKPCEGGVEPLSLEQSMAQLGSLSGWYLSGGGQRIRKDWTAKNFMAAIDFFNRVARVAEDDNHHPDLHLVSYRKVSIELSTHAIGGLSENDFILAAKIDALPIDVKK
jgi:4a-hydroxytetrahydrobiopterin dehydratase